MINLLPYDTRRDLKAARSNTIMLYCILITLLFGLFSVGSYIYVGKQLSMVSDATAVSVSATRNANAARVKSENQTKQDFTTLRSSIQQGSSAITGHISYYTLLTTLADGLPDGSIIQSISSPNGTTLKLTALAKTNAIASSIQSKMSSHRDVFSNISVSSITSGTNSKYPVVVDLSITLTSTRPTL